MKSKYSHIGLLKHAEDFANAATIVVDADEHDKAPIAVYYLFGHAIELALKSVLRLHGESDQSLKKINHHLVRALKRATSHPQKRFFSTELNQAVEMLNPYYSTTALTYYDNSVLMELPKPRELVQIVNKLIEDLTKEYRRLLRIRKRRALTP